LAVFLAVLFCTLRFSLYAFEAHAAQFILPNFTGDNIGQFVKDLYIFSISIVGLAVFIQFLRAGFSYFFKAAGNASETANARSMMTNAVIGAILLLSAYLILYVINPDLVNTNIFDLSKIKPCTADSKPEDPCIPHFNKVSYSLGADPNQKKISCGFSGEIQLDYLKDGSIANGGHVSFTITGDIGTQTTWSAPGGNPDHGTGTTISTTYPGRSAGTSVDSGVGYEISISSQGADGKVITTGCGVHINPYQVVSTGGSEDAVARAKFAQVGITVSDYFTDGYTFSASSLKGINNLTVTQLIAGKNLCGNTAPCTMEITNFKDSALGNDTVDFEVNPSDAWLKRLQDCCTLSDNGRDWTNTNTGTVYTDGGGSWTMRVVGSS